MSVLPPPSQESGDSSDSRPDDQVVGAGLDFTDPSSPLAPCYLRSSHVAAVTLVAVVFLLINVAPLWHTDIWGHLKHGQYILTHLALPQKEPFCPFAEEGSPGLRSYWLGQAGLYLLYHTGEQLAGGGELDRMAGGAALLRFGHAGLVVLRFLILFLAFRRLSGSPGLAAVALLVAVGLNLPNIAILRPQVLAESYFACLLLILSRPLSRAGLILAPLLLVLWANTHGSYVCGLLLVGVVAVGRGVETLWLARRGQGPRLLSDPQFRRLLLVLASALVAVALLNPLGPRAYLEMVRMSSHPNVRQMDEWQPLRFHLGWGGQWAFLASAVLVAITPLLGRRWYSFSALLLIAAFALPPLLHQRLFVWWVMVAPWLLVRYWPDFAGWRSVPSFRKTVAAVGLALAALAWSIPGQWLLDGRPGPLERGVTDRTPWPLTHQLRHPEEADERGMPELQQHLAAHYPKGRFTGTIFTSEHLGDLLIWDLAPQVPVFLYSHVHLFSPLHWQRYMHVRLGGPGWRKALDAYRVNLVVVEPVHSPALCALLRQDREWNILVDPASEEKRDPRQRLLIALRARPR